jgi:hypothetical protein
MTRHMSTPDPLPLFTGIAVLRRLEVNDLAAFQAYRSDSKVGRFQGWSVMSDADARNSASIRLLARVGMQKLGFTPTVFRGKSCTEDSYARYRDSGAEPS